MKLNLQLWYLTSANKFKDIIVVLRDMDGQLYSTLLPWEMKRIGHQNLECMETWEIQM